MGQSNVLPVRRQPLREKSLKVQSCVLLFSTRIENEPDSWSGEGEEGRPHPLPFGTFGEGNNRSINQRATRGQNFAGEAGWKRAQNTLGETLHSRCVCFENVAVSGHGIHK